MLIWYDEETEKEYELKFCDMGIVNRDDCKWVAHSRVDKYGFQVNIWMTGTDEKEFWISACRIERLARVRD